MRTTRLLLTTLLVLTMLLGLVPTASARNVTTYRVRARNITIPWAFPPPEGMASFCAEIPEGININPDDLGSNRYENATVRTLRNGSQKAVLSDIVTGTASDQYGTSYKFLYVNNATYVYDGSVVHVTMKDFFTMRGGEVNFSLSFVWAWAYETENFGVMVVTENGQDVDVVVDPFIFATNDGVNEDPGIIPGSWRQLSTNGDPWNCDPL